jgi:hypothetical protein
MSQESSVISGISDGADEISRDVEEIVDSVTNFTAHHY